jgi:sarcosine oxidase subunit gamma
MIALRADLASLPAELIGAIPAPLTLTGTADHGAGWMSPDELLLFCPGPEVAPTLARLTEGLKGTHHLALDVSAMRQGFRLSGPNAAETLAKLTPVDMAPDRFLPGTFRRTRLGQVAAVIWRDDLGYGVLCFRSVADYLGRLLGQSVADGAVGHF